MIRAYNNNKIWCVIPCFNNEKTINNIVERCKKYINNILIVDDGSTTINLKNYFKEQDFKVIRHKKNLGKGAAILTALKYLNNMNVDYIITLDADGQHYPEDIPIFLETIQEDDFSLIVGERNFNSQNIPYKSRFGKNFSNLWLRLETGVNIRDSQCGFRAYPVKLISKLKFISRHYNFEVEVLAKASWAGIKINNKSINVWYPDSMETRTTNFKPIIDNIRFSLLHIHLIFLRLFLIQQKKIFNKKNKKTQIKFLFHPLKFIKILLREHTSPFELGLSAGLGTLLAVLPLIGAHTLAILYAATRFHLNKIMAVNIQHLFMPPFTPFICIELGHYLLNGEWLKNISINTFTLQIPERIIEWVLGSLFLAPLFAIITGLMVYIVSKTMYNFGKMNRGKFNNVK